MLTTYFSSLRRPNSLSLSLSVSLKQAYSGVAWVRNDSTGCSRKIAQSLSITILQLYTTELCRFQQNVQKKCLHNKAQCLNTAIKYLLLFSWQVNYSKTKQSTWWHITFCIKIGTHTLVLSVRRRLRGKKNFSPENQVRLILLLRVIRFFKRLHAFNRFSLSAAVKDWTSRRQKLWAANRSWQSSQLKNVKFQSLSRLPWTLTCLGSVGFPCWLKIKSLTNSMYESVLTERRRPELFCAIFSATQCISYSAYMRSPARPSVCHS